MKVLNYLFSKSSRGVSEGSGDSYYSSQKRGPNRQKSLFSLIGLSIIGIIVLITVFSCFYTVEETEQAVVTTFGKVSSVETAGLHFKLPFPFQSVEKVAVNKTQKLVIGSKPSNPKDDKSEAVWVSNESKMITEDFNIVNIDFFIEWKISDPVKFVYNSDNPESILKMIAQSSARSIIGSKSVDGVLTTEKPIIQSEIKEKMIHKLSSYDLGVQIIDVKIQDSEPPTSYVISAFKDVETAKQEKETRINEALAYKNKTLPAAQSEADKLIRDAESYKEGKINEAIGAVAKFNAMYSEYAKNKSITKTRMYLETIEEILPGVTVYIDSTDGGVQKMLPLKSFSNTTINGVGGQNND